MPMPPLNFVWIGAPKFLKGGQDVIGPVLLAEHFKTVPLPEGQAVNPMIFWCQEEYTGAYADYFHSRGADIRVVSIDEYLRASAHPKVACVKAFYQGLMNKGFDVPLYCVYAKAIFFNFILATQGGYVLDTTIYPASEKPLHFPAYTKFMYPMVDGHPEIWMQYSPPDLKRANQCLDFYLARLAESALFQEGVKQKKLHTQLGVIGVSAVRLGKQDLLDEIEARECATWDCSPIQMIDTLVPDCNVIKEYTNSHVFNIDKTFSQKHLYIIGGKIDRLEFYLRHGGDVNLRSTVNGWAVVPKIDYDVHNETLLLRAMILCHKELQKACAKLLLEYGADPNIPHVIISARYCEENTPLSWALKKRSEDGLKLLFEHTKIPIDINQLVGGQSYLQLAFLYDCPLPMIKILLEKGVSPNPVCRFGEISPLLKAMIYGRIEVFHLLVAFGADILMYESPLENGHLMIHEAIIPLLREAIETQKLKGRKPDDVVHSDGDSMRLKL